MVITVDNRMTGYQTDASLSVLQNHRIDTVGVDVQEDSGLKSRHSETDADDPQVFNYNDQMNASLNMSRNNEIGHMSDHRYASMNVSQDNAIDILVVDSDLESIHT